MGRCTILYLNVLFLSFFAGACDSHSSSTEESVPALSGDVPKDFTQFYYSFHSDSSFQMNHILFPLEGRSATDQDDLKDNGFRWEQGTWKLHHFDHFDPEQFRVVRKVIDSTLVTEVIQDKKSGLGIKRRFAKFDDKWYLIYYSAMNPM